jgi:carbon storage regulator
MLVLSRKKDEQIIIQCGAETITVRVLGLTSDRVRIGVTAPLSVAVHREEVARRLQAQREAPDQSRVMIDQ